MTVRVFAEAGAVFIGPHDPIPVGSVTAEAVGQEILIWTLSGELLCKIVFTRIRDKDGNHFDALPDALEYVRSEISEPVPTGDPGDLVPLINALLNQGI